MQITPYVPTSRTECIRRLLRETGRGMTAAEIAFDLDDVLPNFGTHLVWLLLKHDVSKGRVTFDGTLYTWSRDCDAALAAAINVAVKLLERNGYRVQKP